ncbi:hypothetical protein [Maribacter sp. 2308TA10-17]|uniref:hypothetical protein n=1 Tax=Maribacter sp. 2308TA10-17 TaxID=3386276 RepID=UPI0039BD59F8
MRKHVSRYSIFIILVSTTINAQRLHELTPYSFYQEWSLVSINSRENLRVYKPKNNSNLSTSNNSSSVLKFKRRNRVFYSLNSGSSRKKRPVNWSNVPKKKSVINRCGTPFIGKKSKEYNQITKQKGVWRVYLKNDDKFLVLKHLVAGNNTGFKLERKELFQIVSLKKDELILRKVNG